MEIVETMVGPLQMGIFPHAEAGGAIVRHEWYKPCGDGPVIYLNAEPDLQRALDRVAGAGGNVLVTKTQISDEHGYMAVFVDSEGNRIALHSSS